MIFGRTTMDIYIIVTRLHVYTNLYVYNFSRFKQSFDILRCVACDVIYVWRRIDRQTNKCLLGKQNTTPKSRTYTVLSYCTYKFVPVYAQSSVHNSIHLCVIASMFHDFASLCCESHFDIVLFYIFRLPLYVKKLKYFNVK